MSYTDCHIILMQSSSSTFDGFHNPRRLANERQHQRFSAVGDLGVSAKYYIYSVSASPGVTGFPVQLQTQLFRCKDKNMVLVNKEHVEKHDEMLTSKRVNHKPLS